MDEIAVKGFSNITDLMQWIITSKDGNPEAQLTFLLGYRIFFSSAEILSVLETMAKHIVQNGTQLSPETQKFNKFLHMWITKLFQLDWKRSNVLSILFDVMKLTMPPDDFNTIRGACVRDMAVRRGVQQVVHHSAGFAKNPQLEVRSPRIILSMIHRPKSMGIDLVWSTAKEWSLVDIPLIVEQMTLIEYEYFSVVQPDEFLKQSWSAASREALAPHLSFLVKRFNEIGFWVATQILTAPTTKQQSKIMRRYIKIAHKLYEIHNFNSMMQILSGLQNLSVVRLRSAWKEVRFRNLCNYTKATLTTLKPHYDPLQQTNYRSCHFPMIHCCKQGVKHSARHKFEDMVSAMSSLNNFQKYREAIERCYNKKPAIPYIVVYMRDLTFAEEISDKTEQGLPNYTKLLRIGKQLLWFKQFAEKPYGFQMDMSVQKVLQELKVISEEEMYQLSLACEPRSPTSGMQSGNGVQGAHSHAAILLSTLNMNVEESVSPRARKSLTLDFLRPFHTSR